jgi:prohibitin 1
MCSYVIPVPLAIAAGLAQASIYDVPGGYRAVMFNRLSGVKDEVSPEAYS